VNQARIAELLRPFLVSSACHSEERGDEKPASLSATQLQSISTYIDILLRWNARINLTAIRDPEEIITRHFGESLFAARHLFSIEPDPGSAGEPRTGQTRASEIAGGIANEITGGIAGGRPGGRAALQGRVNSREMSRASAPALANGQPPATNDRPSVADIGSGAGFPGLPIKLWAPHISLTLIESNHKKAAFLKEVARALTLTDVNIQNARAEAITETTKDRYDLVTLRAVERFETVLPIAAALVAPSGRLALLISSAQEPQARATSPNLNWSPPVPIPLSRSRVLMLAHR
jgi:16S rRNA (guanine(527)-N(7))-methyltransferase RsmG